MSKYAGEQVLVVKRSLFEELGAFQGHQKDNSNYFETLLLPENNFFMDRAEAEEDPSFKQLIPYAIFKCADKFLVYQRGKSGGESRLHAKLSLGIGGHINPIDTEDDSMGEQTYFRALDRELNEELQINSKFTINTLGFVNDDETEVGRVHLGLIHLVTLESEDVASNEEGIANLEFVSLEQLQNPDTFNRLETWSQIAVDLLSN